MKTIHIYIYLIYIHYIYILLYIILYIYYIVCIYIYILYYIYIFIICIHNIYIYLIYIYIIFNIFNTTIFSCLPQNNDWHLQTRFHGTSTKRRHHNHPCEDGIPLHSKGHIGSTARVATKSVQTLRAMTRLLWPPDLKCVAGPPTRSLIRRQVHYGRSTMVMVHYGRSTELSKSQEKSVLANSWPSDVAKDISCL